MALAQRVQAQLVSDLGRIHGVGQVLLVGKDEEHRVAQLILRTSVGSGSTAGGRGQPAGLMHEAGPLWNVACIEGITARHGPAATLLLLISWLRCRPARRQAGRRTSFSILCSSSRASLMRSRSLLSTTKMRPCVFWK